ncbi:MAG TPA: glycosyltransferase family 39 protein [Elusimicrobiota bacterium]|nr:glycosyltransferase family 39 protein [Elusimicrobiota bacterium]
MTALVAIGAALRFLFLGTRSLWFDEASTLILARLPLAGLPALLVRNETNPPLYYALMHVWLKLFADPRLGLRVFSALCGIAALAAFRPLAERLLPARARLLALFFAAFSSFWIHLAQDGRVYALLLLVSVLWLRTVWDLSENPTAKRWSAYAALSALGLHLHYYFAFPLAADAAWLAWRFRRSPRELGAWAAAHAAASLLFAPWLPQFAAQLRAHVGDRTIGDALTPAHLLDSFGTMFFDVTFLGLALPHRLNAAIGAGFAALAAAGAFAAPSDARARRERDFVLFSLAAPVVLIALAELVVRRPITQARYFVPLSPLAYLLAARVLSAPARWTGASRLALEAVAVAGVAGYFASGKLVDPRLDALAAAIRRGSPAGLPVVYVDMYDYLPMRAYYLPERRNLLVASAGEGMDFSAIPPYDGVIDGARTRALGSCVVVDVKRRLTEQALWTGTGAQLAGLLEAAR